MDTGKEQIALFLRRCDELMQSKYIIADTKIGELLQSIAMSDLLYAFFRDASKHFDYAGAKRKYLNFAPYGDAQKKLLFPEDPVERLAFVFCLFMEFDNKTMDLGWFLQEYFYEDGSFYESFYAFCNQVVKPFRNAVKQMFEEPSLRRPLRAPAPQEEAEGERSASFDARCIEREKKLVYSSALAPADKVDALLLLNALAGAQSIQLRCALLSGYDRFARTCGRNNEHIAAMRAELARLKEML